MSKYIDAEVMINALRELRTKHLIQSVFGEDMRDNAVTAGTLEAVAQILDGLPAADVQEVRHGRWADNVWVFTCSECGNDAGERWDYCPHCGAKMDEVEE